MLQVPMAIYTMRDGRKFILEEVKSWMYAL
jgi:hypothetical protein